MDVEIEKFVYCLQDFTIKYFKITKKKKKENGFKMAAAEYLSRIG